ncbi:hypothetical protein L1987_02702 [Smallanthus sonchifolius]|uniref:Uncharacterized protein n=1 Tax=Smallanthus sonchifolius TaxID=185202 RepID=A0ACB9K8N5_9ASTR|nr:hypothetical protein L1987_02702 [Smallanthus sonchifolius]
MNLRPLRKKRDQVDNIKPDSEGISNPCEHMDSEEKLMVVYEEIDHHEALNVSVKTLNTCTPWFNILTILLLFYFQVLKHAESNGSNADSISCDTDNPSDSLGSVLEMKNEVLECNGSTNNNENPSISRKCLHTMTTNQASVDLKSNGKMIKELQNASCGAVQSPMCRPWDKEELLKRLATFKSMTWFAKPKVRHH